MGKDVTPGEIFQQSSAGLTSEFFLLLDWLPYKTKEPSLVLDRNIWNHIIVC